MKAAVERPDMESPMRTSRRLAAALVLSALLAGPLGASGAKVRSPGTPPKAKPAPAFFLSRVWSIAREIRDKAGCGIDPSGQGLTTPAPANSLDEGCGIDPSGRCHS
jgi:hypothetical protein